MSNQKDESRWLDIFEAALFGEPQSSIAHRFGISVERVRQLQYCAIRLLKSEEILGSGRDWVVHDDRHLVARREHIEQWKKLIAIARKRIKAPSPENKQRGSAPENKAH